MKLAALTMFIALLSGCVGGYYQPYSYYPVYRPAPIYWGPAYYPQWNYGHHGYWGEHHEWHGGWHH